MHAEFDFDLSPDQWETLRALRAGATLRGSPSPCAITQLAALGLASIGHDGPLITAMGRKVLIRGSSRLWEDVAV
jgi:hypothetical protein